MGWGVAEGGGRRGGSEVKGGRWCGGMRREGWGGGMGGCRAGWLEGAGRESIFGGLGSPSSCNLLDGWEGCLSLLTVPAWLRFGLDCSHVHI